MKPQQIHEQQLIRENIDTLMREKGWSPKTLAERSGVGVGTVYNIRSAGQVIGDGVLFKIAKALGTTTEHLKGQDDPDAQADISSLPVDEQEMLLHFRRVPANKRRAIVKVFRDMVDSLVDAP